MARRGSVALLILALWGSSPALALDPGKAVTQYIHDVWQTEQGLPQNVVQAICQTRDGYLWLGTQEGVVRFDGVRFVAFDNRNTPALANNSISALHEDREGSLWIGTRGAGLVRMRDGVFTRLTTANGLTNDHVRAIYEDREGNLWIGTSGGGLNRFRNGAFTSYTTRQGLSNDQVVSIYQDREGALWVGTFGGGLNRFKDGRFTAFGKKDGLAGDLVSAIVEDRSGNLWIATFENGLSRLTKGRFTTFDHRHGLVDDRVSSLLEDRDGSLWVASGGGVARISGGKVEAFATGQGLSYDDAVVLFEDRERELWIGTYGGGLNRLRDGKFSTFTTKEGLSNDVALSVYQDRRGTIWVGTSGGGVNRYEGGRFSALTTRNGLSNDQVTAIWEDRAGGLWFGTLGGGVNRLKDGRLSALSTRDGLSNDVVTSIYEDRAGSIWIGTDGGGLNRLSSGRFTTFTTGDGLGSDHVTSIHEDGAGRLWVGTGGGLSRFQDGRFTTVSTKDGLSNDVVTSLYDDPAGSLWIGTSGGGLNRLRDGRLTAFTTRAGLFDDRVFTTLEDARGNLWMSCNRGIFRASLAELRAFADGKLKQISSPSYGTADGMRSVECNGEMQNAGWRMRDGRLWIPTIKGVVVIDPERLAVNALPPPVMLEEAVVDGVPRRARAGSLLTLEPGTAKLDLHYTALSFPAPQRVRFKYQLEGFDSDWIDAGSERTAHYTRVPPGSYRFRVKASNDDGLWNETGAALELRQLPFFHQTRAFQALVALGLVLLGLAAHRLRIRALKRRATQLEGVVREQTRDLRAANDGLRQAQEQLARLSQATPEKLENVAAWGTSMAQEIGRAIRADRVHLWRAEGETLVALSPGAGTPPSWDAVQAARTRELASGDAATIVPVAGMTDEIRGALVIEGPVVWGDTERRLVTGLAQHLGSALDLQHLRQQLTVTEARQAEVRRRMLEQGVATLLLCPRCGRCYDQSASQCEADRSRLDGSRLLPYRVSQRYRLTTLLGEGGMGSVFAAHDEKLRREVALKVIRAEMLSDAATRFRLEREAQALARVSHPSVIGLYDSGELEDGSAFLVMELLSGSDLARVLVRHGRGSPAQVAVLLRQVGAALAAAHRVGVIHRDVKPANIFVVPDRESFACKVLDFGLAKSLRSEARLTQTGALMGTPAYMSPEQVEGKDVDERTDLYALAAVAFEALTGRPVVEAQEVPRMLVDVLYATAPQVSSLITGLAPEVDAAFEAALAKQADERPSDLESWALALAAQLDAAAEGVPGWPLALLRTARRSPLPAADDEDRDRTKEI